MKRLVTYENLDQRLQEVETIIKQEKNRRLYERYQAISLHLKGYTNKDIAGILCRTHITIGTYVKQYKENGLEGLAMSYSPGAPRRLKPEQEEAISELVLKKTPADVGLKTTMNWTAPLLKEWIKREYGVAYKDRAILTILSRLGFSHTRATYTLAKAEPEKQQVFCETFNMYKKN
jgi:transposase